MPEQTLPFDKNAGAGFWWANNLNLFTGNTACECDRYGFHFEMGKRADCDPVREVRQRPRIYFAVTPVRTGCWAGSISSARIR